MFFLECICSLFEFSSGVYKISLIKWNLKNSRCYRAYLIKRKWKFLKIIYLIFKNSYIPYLSLSPFQWTPMWLVTLSYMYNFIILYFLIFLLNTFLHLNWIFIPYPLTSLSQQKVYGNISQPNLISLQDII